MKTIKTFEIKLPKEEIFSTIRAIPVKTAVKQFLPERGDLRLDNGMYTTDRGFSLYGERDFKPGQTHRVRAYFQTKGGAFTWYFIEVRRVR